MKVPSTAAEINALIERRASENFVLRTEHPCLFWPKMGLEYVGGSDR